MSSKRVVIVGAGPGGLASALLLAKAGVEVTILEAKSQVGGRTTTMEEEGFRFDLGPTFFHYPRVLGDVFKAIGRDLFTEIPMVKLDPQYTLLFGEGGELQATRDPERMREQIRAISPGDADGFDRFMTENRAKLAAFRPILEAPFQSWRDLLKSYVMKALPLLRPTRSVDQDLQQFFTDARLRIAFSFQSKYLGMSPYRCPSLFSILSFLEYEFGIFHPIGGCGAITRRMAEIAEEMGVEIRLDEPVTNVEFHGKKVVALKTNEATYTADSFVINADFATAMQSLIPDSKRKRWSDKKLKKAKYSCSTFMMYLGIDGQYDRPHHTIYISDDYAQNLKDIEDQHQLSVDPSIYVQNACVSDDTLAPSGQSTLYVLAPVSNLTGSIDWPAERERFRSLVLKQMAKAGFEDVESRIRYEKIITPVDWQQNHYVHRGAVFNLAHNLGQMLHFRPRNRYDDLESVYLVGGGTHPGSGLPVIFESARISSRLLLNDLGLDFPGPSEATPTPEDEPLLAGQ